MAAGPTASLHIDDRRPGSLVPAGALSVALVAAFLLAGRLSGALLAAAVPAAAGVSDVLVKPLVHRTYLGNLRYPSGHAARPP